MFIKTELTKRFRVLASVVLVIAALPVCAQEGAKSLHKPDDKPGAVGKPIKVFILMGQSNMIGMGDIGPETAKGTLTYLTKKEVRWYAGKQYDDDMTNAKEALKNIDKWHPGYKEQGYEIAGFVWWQGHKDTGNAAHASKYEENLERLIVSLRKDYDAPNAKFVLATGCGNPGREGLGKKIAEAQFAVGDVKKYPKFNGNVKAVDSRDLWREADVSPKNQGYHYNRNAETYVEVGLRLGWAIAEILKK